MGYGMPEANKKTSVPGLLDYWLPAPTFDPLPPSHSILNTPTGLGLFQGLLVHHSFAQHLQWLPSHLSFYSKS